MPCIYTSTIKNVLKINDAVERLRHRHDFFEAVYKGLTINRERNIGSLTNIYYFGNAVPTTSVEPFVNDVDNLVMWYLLLQLTPSDNIPLPLLQSKCSTWIEGKPIELQQEDDLFGFWCCVAQLRTDV